MSNLLLTSPFIPSPPSSPQQQQTRKSQKLCHHQSSPQSSPSLHNTSSILSTTMIDCGFGATNRLSTSTSSITDSLLLMSPISSYSNNHHNHFEEMSNLKQPLTDSFQKTPPRSSTSTTVSCPHTAPSHLLTSPQSSHARFSRATSFAQQQDSSTIITSPSKKRLHPLSVLSPHSCQKPHNSIMDNRKCMTACNKTNRRVTTASTPSKPSSVVKRLDFSNLNDTNQEGSTGLTQIFSPFSPKSLSSPKAHTDAFTSQNLSPTNRRRNCDHSLIMSPTNSSTLHADRFIPQRCTSSEMEIAKHLMFTSNEPSTPPSSKISYSQSSNSGQASASSTIMNMPYQFESCLESRLLDSRISDKKIFKFKPTNFHSLNSSSHVISMTGSMGSEETYRNGSQQDHSEEFHTSSSRTDSCFNNQENIRRGNVPSSSMVLSSPKHALQSSTSADSNIQNKLQAVFSCNKQFSQMTEMEKRQLYQSGYGSGGNSKQREISSLPERVLDAPKMLDDFYLNLLDWSSQNVLAVALYDTVYLWDANNGNIHMLTKTSGDSQEEAETNINTITSVAWTMDGAHLAVGTNHCTVELWNVERRKLVRKMLGHSSRVGSLSWNPRCQPILSSGSRDGKILNHDVRVGPGGLYTQSTHGLFMQQHESIPNYPNQVTSVFTGHSQEVCGLKWSPDGSQLASGGNDNTLHIWDASAASFSSSLFTFNEHVAAVKALAWCPWQAHLLASGGGTADRKIHFWNTSNGALLNSVDTKSQVCSLLWSKYDRELVSSHGFSQNQLIIWKYPSLRKVAELTGHTSRVLHLAQSPDGSHVVSAAGDETLRFWKIFSSASDILHASGNTNQLSYGAKQFGRFFTSSNTSNSLNDMMSLR
ncbi:hypothetical protein C9374_007075 [Naegleria lovaniensis]|uniref:CDC20/Fizzy WD40 domain-containing protein n=1 Tax=Naegleria lovaniensis TaxID=51637 RepID=A0AA88H4R9_NAELO|nr:uncharacterized protein C9374_007075 [Naegleria lovaniensis]KAG2393544.1 hypothetical protein C9374_007075 [Naegleria lovaniensis]